MSIPLGLSSDALCRLKRMEIWVQNFKVVGPDVSGQNTSDGAAYRIGRPISPLGSRAADESVPVQVTGLVDGATSRYLGNLFTGPINDKPGATLLESDLGTLATSQVEVWNLSEIDSGAPLEPPIIVLAKRAGRNTDSNMPIYFVTSGLPDGVLFQVDCSQDGGSAGSLSAGATCSFTYSVTDPASRETLGASMTPVTPRFPTCKYNPGNGPGLGYYSAPSASFVLYSVANEIPTTVVAHPIAALRIDGTNFEMQTQAQLVLDTGANSDWEVWAGGTICPGDEGGS